MKLAFIFKIIVFLVVAITVIAFTIYPRAVEHGIDYFMENYLDGAIFEAYEFDQDEYDVDNSDYAYDDYDSDYDYDLSR